MKLPRPQFGIKSLLALMLFVGVACAAWPHMQPFTCLQEDYATPGGATTTDTTYVWRCGLALTIMQAPGQWPSIRRRTDIDVARLEQETEIELDEAMREQAEEQAAIRQAAR